MTASSLRSIVPLFASALLISCSTVANLPTERIASATLTLGNGIPAGNAQLLASGDRVSLAVAVTGLAEGEHGFHLHTTGECKRPDFTSAGGHLNPLDKEHGSLNPDGKHIGDLPNLQVSAGGTGSATVDLEGSREALERWLFDADGTAIVVHAGADDYRSDPAGDAGPRVACGVLKRAG